MKLHFATRLVVASVIALGGLAAVQVAEPDDAKAGVQVCAELYRIQGGNTSPVVPWTCVGSAAAPPVLCKPGSVVVFGTGAGYNVCVDTQ